MELNEKEIAKNITIALLDPLWVETHSNDGCIVKGGCKYRILAIERINDNTVAVKLQFLFGAEDKKQ